MENAGFVKSIAPQERSRHAAGMAFGEQAKRSPRVLGRIPNKHESDVSARPEHCLRTCFAAAQTLLAEDERGDAMNSVI